MYNNIGEKIKSLAKCIFFVEALSAVITGIALIADEEVVTGLLVILCGVLVAWVSTWLLYGYGQLIENSDIIAEEYKRVNKKNEKVVEKKNAEKQEKAREKAKAMIADAEVADEEFIDVVCSKCKADLCYTKEQIKSGEDLICPMCDAQLIF